MPEEQKTHLRFGFVELLFALTAAEIAIQFADVHSKVGLQFIAAPAYAHLTLALILVATSWVGWSISKAPGATKDVHAVFSADFLVLLIDVLLVIFYFIVVKGVDSVKIDENRMITTVASASHEAIWIAVIFAGYFIWDFMTKAVIGSQESGTPITVSGRFFSKKFWGRAGDSIACLALALIACFVVYDVTSVEYVLLADFALLALVLLFRALKQGAQSWKYLLITCFVSSLAVVQLGCK